LAWHISLQDVEFFHAFLPARQRAQPDTQWVEAAMACLLVVDASQKRIEGIIAIRATALLTSASSALSQIGFAPLLFRQVVFFPQLGHDLINAGLVTLFICWLQRRYDRRAPAINTIFVDREEYVADTETSGDYVLKLMSGFTLFRHQSRATLTP